MKLGLLTAAFPTLTLEEIAAWAGSNGFSRLEVACWPPDSGAARRYAGVAHIDVERLTAETGKRLLDDLERHGVEISALAYYPNPLHPDLEARQAAQAHLRRVIEAAEVLGVGLVTTFAGNDRHRPLPENLESFARVWPELVRHAADHGVSIAIENCPMIFSYDEWPGGDNLAHSPAVWRQMFEIVPASNFGLNLDPSHLLWLQIDIERAVREFAPRILHAHAKDLEVSAEGLYEHGVLSLGIGWQVPRLCGHGQIDWSRFIGVLYGVGYDGTVSVEHEDRRFEGSVDLVQRGFEIAQRTLAPLIG